MSEIEITSVNEESYGVLSLMVGELLSEIMDAVDEKVFNFDRNVTEKRAKGLIDAKKYWVFMANDIATGDVVGFVSLYESYALYAEGAYGTIPELYVRPAWRSNHVGTMLLESVMGYAKTRGWKRLEVTTPPLPEFDRTLHFYQTNGFEISGGRKLKVDIN